MAATDLGKVGIVMKGTWSSSAAYEVLDAVSYNSGLYIAKQAVPANTLPTNTTYWQPGAIIPDAPNKMADGVDITSYATLSNTYTFPADGYVSASSEQAQTGSIQIPIRGNNGKPAGGIYMNITARYQVQSMYVRKGMYCWCQNVASGGTVVFNAFTT